MECYTVRFIINKQNIRKISLDKKPDTLEELKIILRDKFNLEHDFNLMYEDPEFNNALCNLDDIAALPARRATLKLISLLPMTSSPPSSTPSLSDDTEILSSPTPTRREKWPEFFDVPNFSVDVECRLRQANLAFTRDKIYANITRDMKHRILEKLAEQMYKFDAYPDDERIHSVALALISKHPCLTEPGSPNGCSGWKNSLKFKMGNYRTKMRRAGCVDVCINGGKQRVPGMLSKCLKRPKRFEVNYLPGLPDGQNEESLEVERKALAEEMRKKICSATAIASKMEQTFPVRRREIVETGSPVQTVMERWPALFTEKQVYAEFNRIATTNLRTDFFDALDRYTPRLITILKSKRGNVGQTLTELLKQINVGKPDVTAMRSLVLKGLPVLLGDDPDDFYKTCFDSENEEAFGQMSVGLLTSVREDAPRCSPNLLHLDALSMAIVIEGRIVMSDLLNLPQALCLLFGLLYSLHLEYPKSMKNTFSFIQKVMLGLGENKLSPKLQTLKNLLLS
ncbi:uncharacterized protein LOC125710059 isoform X1 [Brienomyrus brachyistius]|uniref:uncharacterized protein LOC125710059 isoform X1 n=1 Tax=Brienomyrus brachyistius TaxID=42636 RepID=UPI0020B2B1F2|nr:uncharacterized protein LOC125710059 isoform X1 [Brienomyrus brachyistius]XP_048835195.1 uncharacterized protein LOC125710059 isoform X1 [Brienomyrus brachyistius]XP_048835196.1 uncharacterized protein LOC125710059 isoform X1 [Brienomyrus brachyistius]